jgi:2-desacetyl-2-hydroxyethyl bacteriochlorophyllide A dehydrogenase
MEDTMKAAVLKAPEQLVVEEIPISKIHDDELLVEVGACGICGSDLRYLEGHNPWALHTLGVDAPNPPNMVLGHEFGGVVVKAGSSRNTEWIGKRVVVAPFDTCGVCRACRTGNEHLCMQTIHTGHGAGWGDMEYYPGAMAQYCRAWARRCYEIPGEFPMEHAALLDIAGVAYHALGVGELKPGHSVAIVGMGPLGVLSARIAALRGATDVFGIDIYDRPLRFAEASGAHPLNSTTNPEWQDSVISETGGWGADVVIDTIGLPETLAAGRQALAPGGTLVLLAVHSDVISFPTTGLAGERKMVSSANYRFVDFQRTIDLAVSGRLKLDDLITHRVPLDRVEEGFRLLRDKERSGALKVIVIPREL